MKMQQKEPDCPEHNPMMEPTKFIVNDSIKIYKQNTKSIANLEAQEDKIKKAGRKKEQHISEKMWEIKRKLEEKERKKIHKIQENTEKAIQKLRVKMTPLSDSNSKIDKLLGMCNIIRENPTTDFSVYTYIDRDEQNNYIHPSIKKELVLFAFLRQDRFKRIAVYIVKNRKPTNKFSLIAMGRSILTNYNFYIENVCEENCNIRVCIRDAPTKEELHSWYLKNIDKILKGFLQNHAELEKTYEEAEKLYKLKCWKIFFLEKQINYYENHVYKGIETEEYKAFVKELKEDEKT